MPKSMVACLAFVFFLSVAIGASAQSSEDEIVQSYIQKLEKRHSYNIGYISFYGSYGKISESNMFHSPVVYGYTDGLSSNIGIVDPSMGIFRSKEFGLKVGMMAMDRLSFNVGFEYWLPIESNVDVDYTVTSGTLVQEGNIEDQTDVSVYGFGGGLDWHFLGKPDNEGVLNSLSVTAGAGAGYYFGNWNLWQEEDGSGEQPSVSFSAPAFWVQAGAEYPIGLWDMVVGLDVKYLILNFKEIAWYEELSTGDFALADYSGNPVELDFSGPRARVELKKYMRW